MEFLIFILLIFIGTISLFFLHSENTTSSFFHAVSALSTTGFNFENFPSMSESTKLLFITLMFIGGCYFSTSGGIKIYRLITLFRSVKIAIKEKLGVNDEKIDISEVLISLLTISFSVLIVFIATFIFTIYGNPFTDSLFQSVAAYSTGGMYLMNLNYNAFLKSVLITLMIIGRVEIFVFLVAISRYKQE
jgi:trk system potassium uptake protein TrkH